LRDGQESWVLIHIEVQSQRETNFAKRMYVYNYRIFDRHDRFVVSLAVLSDDNPLWKPNQFGYNLWGFRMEMEFPIVKLLDYRNKWDELEKSQNPFAVVVMAHLKTQETSNNDEDRKKWKSYLAKRLYERGYEREDIIQLLKFIDWIMYLPEELNKSFWQEIHEYEEENLMPYVLSIERTALQEGMQQEVRRLLLQILKIKFETISVNLIERVNSIADTDTLEILHHHAVLCNSIEDFESKLNNVVSKEV
ncbi:MAG: hypothetical protein QG641_423, partial [Candidatus Poribacteria bacterium]|nr:hypothetical protein [Candidatus Poribacteria bacterium]